MRVQNKYILTKNRLFFLSAGGYDNNNYVFVFRYILLIN